MTTKPDPSAPAEPLSLKRWSRRKLDAARTRQQESPAASEETSPIANAAPALPGGPGVPPAAVELPPVESLTPESDFTAFFQPQGKVDEALKRAALKQLFRDPQFNVMDGLDIYVGDYTQSDPIPDEVLQRLVQARAIFNPPKTMRTPEGHVVDVPPDAEPVAPEEAPAAIGHVPAEPGTPVAIDSPVAGHDRKTGETP
jgi:hypothetical protein